MLATAARHTGGTATVATERGNVLSMANRLVVARQVIGCNVTVAVDVFGIQIGALQVLTVASVIVVVRHALVLDILLRGRHLVQGLWLLIVGVTEHMGSLHLARRVGRAPLIVAKIVHADRIVGGTNFLDLRAVGGAVLLLATGRRLPERLC